MIVLQECRMALLALQESRQSRLAIGVVSPLSFSQADQRQPLRFVSLVSELFPIGFVCYAKRRSATDSFGQFLSKLDLYPSAPKNSSAGDGVLQPAAHANKRVVIAFQCG